MVPNVSQEEPTANPNAQANKVLQVAISKSSIHKPWEVISLAKTKNMMDKTLTKAPIIKLSK